MGNTEVNSSIRYFGITMPSGNKRDDMTGYILAISNLWLA
jgi:hypothetical protein